MLGYPYHSPITKELLEEHKEKLLGFSRLTETDIQNRWIGPGEKSLTPSDLERLEYSHRMPLYQTMIFRYRNSERSACRFAYAADPLKKREILSYFGLYDEGPLIDFFAWIGNGLGIYDLYMLNNETSHGEMEDMRNTEFYRRWKNNEVEFYFTASEDIQRQLLSRYNALS